MTRKRVGIVMTRLGIPTEIWALRQCAAFRRLDPVLFAWSREPDGVAPPAGVEVRVFGTSFPPPRDLPHRLAGRLGLAWGERPSPVQRRDIRRTLLAAELDVVLCHFAWTAIPVVEALDGALPVVAQVHGRDVSALMRRAAYTRALARTLPRLDALAAVGRFQLDRLRPLGAPPRSRLLPCGAPLDLFAARAVPVREPGTPPRFVAVGRLSEEKGVMETLAAFERVRTEIPDAELVVIGDGPLAGALREAVAGSPAGAGVRLAGRLAPEAVAAELAAAHVFVQHSREAGGWIEGFGVTLTEAGAAGLPLAASRFGGIPDQVEDGVNGLLFAPGDVAAQAAAMLRLARDEDLRRRMGAAARETAARFDSTLLAERMEDLLLEVASGAGDGHA